MSKQNSIYRHHMYMYNFHRKSLPNHSRIMWSSHKVSPGPGSFQWSSWHRQYQCIHSDRDESLVPSMVEGRACQWYQCIVQWPHLVRDPQTHTHPRCRQWSWKSRRALERYPHLHINTHICSKMNLSKSKLLRKVTCADKTHNISRAISCNIEHYIPRLYYHLRPI